LSIKRLHPDFKLNGISYSKETLNNAAHNFIEEGEPHEKAIGRFLKDWLDDANTIVVQTSGSTGIPKRIALRKAHMVNSAIATGAFFNLKPGNSALLCLSVNFIAGKMMLVRAMVLGLQIDCVAPASSPIDAIDKTYDFGAMVPMQLQNAIPQIRKIKTLLVGGAMVSYEMRKRLKTAQSRIFETYGMTETITHIAVKEMETQIGEETPYFKTLPDVHIAVDSRGCLLITAPKVSNEPIVTNDMVRLKSDGQFQWLGRYDNVINSGGVKLHPETIELKLSPLIKERFFVAGIPDVVLGHKLVLIIEGQLVSKKLLEIIKAKKVLDRFEMPKAIITLPKFKLTENGKLNRNSTIGLIKT